MSYEGYEAAKQRLLMEPGVEMGTLMKGPCLRYRDTFIAAMFDKADALIIKVSPERVNELIEEGIGMEFNFTKKRFKEWVVIPLDFESEYEHYIREALGYAKGK